MLVHSTTEVSFDDVIGALEQEIRSRSGGPHGPAVCITDLEALADRLDDLGVAVEAFLKLHTAQVPAPVLSEAVPAWAGEQLDCISDELAPEKYQASCVIQLVERAVKGQLVGRITEGPWGSIQIDWQTSKFLQWRIQQPTNNWPSVKVRVFYKGANGQVKTRTFRWIDSLISHMVGYLETA